MVNRRGFCAAVLGAVFAPFSALWGKPSRPKGAQPRDDEAPLAFTIDDVDDFACMGLRAVYQSQIRFRSLYSGETERAAGQTVSSVEAERARTSSRA